MTKYFILLLIAVSLSVSFGFSSNANKNQFVSFSATPTPKNLAEIERVELDKYEALYICPCLNSGVSPFPNGCGLDENGNPKKDNLLITVKTIVRNPKNTPLVYEYKVSGGQVVGQGNEVIWNLEGVRPGVYTITTSIKGKSGVSAETKTQSVSVSECECLCPCVCPTLSVTGKEIVRASESLVFTANVSGGIATDIRYNWTVSQGEIVSGQGTSQIKVKTTREMTGFIKATVEIGGNLCDMCKRIESATVEIVK
jgi:hypothetical protein